LELITGKPRFGLSVFRIDMWLKANMLSTEITHSIKYCNLKILLAELLTIRNMKVTDIGNILDKQSSVLKEIKNWLALLGLIVLAAEVVLIIALLTAPKTGSMYQWYVPLMLFLLLIIIAGFFNDRHLTAQSNDFYKLKKIENKIVGKWWEFMHHHNKITLSVVDINFDSNQLQFRLSGKAYDQDSKIIAKWVSEACAVTNLSSPEIHYFWKGEHFVKEELEKKYSGVGVIRFPDIHANKEINSGEGWFTSGNISELMFTGKYKIEFIRCSNEEIKILSEGESAMPELLKERYHRWKDKFA
jgi:hypothetical protein